MNHVHLKRTRLHPATKQGKPFSIAKMTTATTNQREFYRLVYPVNSGPKFRPVGKREFAEVIEISQGGFRVRGAIPGAKCGDFITGTIHFADEPALAVASVKRVCKDYTVLVLTLPLPILQVIKEQVRLRRDYPG